jgi:hypothetical protein
MTQQTLTTTFWKPGSIVKLKEPSKPAFAEPEEYGFTREEWREWDGFTHGIIVQILGSVWERHREVKRVSIHLYDPITRRIDMHPSGIPTYVDYRISDLIPFHDSAVETTGYETIRADKSAVEAH